MYWVWVIIFSCLTPTLAQNQQEYDTCTLSTREEGVCTRISNCPYAQNIVRDGKHPTLCGFTDLEPITCCPVATTHKRKQPLLIESTTSAFTSDESIGALSRKKCLDFYPKPKYPTLITGGRPSLAREFPHMAIIGFGDQNDIKWNCGGSLVSNNFVITAAHCLSSRDLGIAKWIRLGDLDIASDKDDADPQDFTVKRRIPHPLYNPPVRYHDIALLELDRKVALSAYVSPACLHTERTLKGNRMTATGWGKTEFTGGSSSFLLKVDLDYISNENCTSSFGPVPPTLLPNGIVDDWQICAGGVIGSDTCQGDSGGPLQVPNKARTFLVRVHTIIGITSFGKACGLSKSPGIYIRISNYIPWIESIVWPNENVSTTNPVVL